MGFLCAANWKMNLSYKEAESFLNPFSKSDQFQQNKLPFLKSELCIFPQALQATLFKNQKLLNWGAQDFYFESQGAYTGQNSPDLYKELGANIMLIGHSERRTLFHEMEVDISKKVLKCVDLDLVPMLCVGETLEERKSNKTLDIIKNQLKSAFISGSDPKKSGDLKFLAPKIIIAYEPVWAIGTGLTAKPEDVEKVHDFIKSIVGLETAVLYGGSVKPENSKELSMIPSVNGFLIGGASLKVDSFLSIYNNSVKN